MRVTAKVHAEASAARRVKRARRAQALEMFGRLSANADAYVAHEISYEEFDRVARATWAEIDGAGLHEAVQALAVAEIDNRKEV